MQRGLGPVRILQGFFRTVIDSASGNTEETSLETSSVWQLEKELRIQKMKHKKRHFWHRKKEAWKLLNLLLQCKSILLSNMIAFFQIIFCYKILKCNKFTFYKADISLISPVILTIILLFSVVSGIKKGSRHNYRSQEQEEWVYPHTTNQIKSTHASWKAPSNLLYWYSKGLKMAGWQRIEPRRL